MGVGVPRLSLALARPLSLTHSDSCLSPEDSTTTASEVESSMYRRHPGQGRSRTLRAHTAPQHVHWPTEGPYSPLEAWRVPRYSQITHRPQKGSRVQEEGGSLLSEVPQCCFLTLSSKGSSGLVTLVQVLTPARLTVGPWASLCPFPKIRGHWPTSVVFRLCSPLHVV